MQWNKKSASMVVALSLLLGSAGAIGFQVHAQQNTTPTSPVKIQVQSTTIGEQGSSTIDKENIQNQKNDKEVKDSIEANENLPGGGHQDQNGVTTDHQFEGVE